MLQNCQARQQSVSLRRLTQNSIQQTINQQPAILYSCDLGIAKPNPDIYRAALTQLGSLPESTLMVGDSRRSDVDGPLVCGIRGLLLDRDGKSSGDSVLRALSDVTSYVSS